MNIYAICLGLLLSMAMGQKGHSLTKQAQEIPSQQLLHKTAVPGAYPAISGLNPGDSTSGKIAERAQRFYHHIMFGASLTNDGAYENVGLLSGYMLNEYVGLGLGVHYNLYHITSALPVYLQSRLYLKREKTSLYGFTGLGWGFAWQNRDISDERLKVNARGGWMAQAGLGWQINFKHAALSFTLAYKLQKTLIHYEILGYPYTPGGGWEQQAEIEKILDVKEKRLYRPVEFTVGLTL